jgi:hypothetical protein
VRAGDHFHIGIVVDDLDAAMEEMHELFGYEWCPVLAIDVPVVLPDRDIVLDLRFTYSTEAPRLELIQEVAGTPWVRASGSGIHHAGYWSEDVDGDGRLLAARGYDEEARGTQPDGTTMWAYHRSPEGLRIELVSREIQPGLEGYWAST